MHVVEKYSIKAKKDTTQINYKFINVKKCSKYTYSIMPQDRPLCKCGAFIVHLLATAR